MLTVTDVQMTSLMKISTESGGVDADGDLAVDDFTDANGDGFDDGLDGIAVEIPDNDGDGIGDVLDNDGVLDDEGIVVTPTSADEGVIFTGLDGGAFGCSVGSAGSGSNRVDPSMPMMLLLSLCGLFYSRKANGRVEIEPGAKIDRQS